MKSIRKILFVMAAPAAVFGFVACSDDDDNVKLVDVPEAYKKYYTDIEITISGGKFSHNGDEYTKK